MNLRITQIFDMPLRRRYFLIAIIISLVVLVICTRHVWFPKYDNVEEIVHDHFQPKRSGVRCTFCRKNDNENIKHEASFFPAKEIPLIRI